MAEATLFKVTEEERRIAWELSTQHYYDILADERAEGREEGARQKTLETAAAFKRLGVKLDTIAAGTGLSREEIAAL